VSELKDTGVTAYVAGAEKYEPICVVGENGGYSVNVWHTNGTVTGAALFGYDGELLGSAGLVPPEEL